MLGTVSLNTWESTSYKRVPDKRGTVIVGNTVYCLLFPVCL
nr:MAG TPA: hypothetical protein [Caudoviricetes sp.]